MAVGSFSESPVIQMKARMVGVEVAYPHARFQQSYQDQIISQRGVDTQALDAATGSWHDGLDFGFRLRCGKARNLGENI